MKKIELVKLIKKIVQFEVRLEVGKQLNEIFINEGKSELVETVEPEEKVQLVDILIEEHPKEPSKSKKKIFYTSNKIINEVLNKTEGGIPHSDNAIAIQPGGTTALPISQIAEKLGYGNMTPKKTKREIAAVDTIKQSGRSLDEVPDDIKNALTRDYSKLIKAMNK